MIGIVALDRAMYLAEGIAGRLRSVGVPFWRANTFDHPDLADTRVLVNIAVPCGGREMDAAPRLYSIVSPLLGYEFIDCEAATQRGIAVCNGQIAEISESMAEAAILLALALLYRLHDAEQAMGRWGNGMPVRNDQMLKGRTLGIIGSGDIARAVSARLERWNCRILVYSRSNTVLPKTLKSSLEDLLAASDVVLVATRLDAGTRHLLNGKNLALMKKGAVLVNIARGAIIDEAALIRSLQEGHLGGAALDVFETEPLPADSALRTLPNVILTPHAIGHTEDAERALLDQAMVNAMTLAKGELPATCRNPAVAEAWRAARSAG